MTINATDSLQTFNNELHANKRKKFMMQLRKDEKKRRLKS
jgi:hypothetical protein